MKKIMRWVRGFLMIWGAIFLISVLFGLFTAYNLKNASEIRLADELVLTATLEGEIPEVFGSPDITSPFLMPPARFQDVMDAIDNASRDPRVSALAFRIRPNSLSVAQVQELRTAIMRFRVSGKPAYAYATAYGDFSNGMSAYYLATAFDEIWVQPIGNVSITGLSGQLPFFKGTLEKIGVTAEMSARASYKTAVEPLTRTEPSAANREMTQRLLSTIFEQMVTDMADARDMPAANMKALIDIAPLSAEQALAGGLVDRIGYQDELVDLLNGDDETRPVPLYDIAFYNEGLKSDPFHTLSEKMAANKARDKAAQKAKTDTAPADTIAVIYASGAIVQGDVRDVTAPGAALGGSPTISAERMVHAITAARGNPRVGTILLRIDSPGGSATASETIARALERAQADGKSIVVSMSGSAASGGYWIAAKTDRIFALPATMTGSIGVLGGKISVGGLLDKVDANIVEYNYGRNAGLWSSTSTFTPSERAQVDKLLDNTYEAFLARVSEGRGIPVATLRNEIAGGRVWTGAEALQIGLVDELGGMAEAVAYSKSLMMPETPDAVRLQEYPPRKSQLEMLADLLVNGVSMHDPMGRIQKALTLKAREAAQDASRMDVYTNLPEFE